PDLARRIVANRNPGSNAGTDDEDRRGGELGGEILVRPDERRDRRGDADAGQRFNVDEASDEQADLVARPLRLGGQPPPVDEPMALEEAEHRLGVADVDGEQAVHRGRAYRCFLDRPMRTTSASSRSPCSLSTARARSAVSPSIRPTGSRMSVTRTAGSTGSCS